VFFADLFLVNTTTTLFALLLLTHCVIALSSPLSFTLLFSEFESVVFKIQALYIVFTSAALYISYTSSGLEGMIITLLLMQVLRLCALLAIPFLFFKTFKKGVNE